METTVILLKPDCRRKKLCGEVMSRFEKGGLEIRGCKVMNLSEDILRDHYFHLVNLPFFPEILEFMQSAPVMALALSGENAIAKIRDMVGPTDSKAAAPGTIRGDMGEDKMQNIVHASDSSESAQAELKRFFQEGELV